MIDALNHPATYTADKEGRTTKTTAVTAVVSPGITNSLVRTTLPGQHDALL